MGAGFGAIHGAAFALDSRVRVAAACARSRERAAELAAKIGADETFDDWRTLLRSRSVDVISLAVPSPAQATIGLAALDAGLPVLFEKPLAPSVAEAQAIATRARGVPTAINFEFPEIPAFAAAKRLLENGALGPLRHAAVTWMVETYANRRRLDDSWKTRAAEGGGALNLLTSHVFHNVEWLLGPIAQLSAALRRAPSDGRTGDTWNQLSLDVVSGLPIAVTVATDASVPSGHRIEVFGDDGALRLENVSSDWIRGFVLYTARRGEGWQSSPIEEVPAAVDARIPTTAAIARRLVDCVLGGPPCRPGVVEGLRVARLMDAARRSSQEGVRVDTSGEKEP